MHNVWLAPTAQPPTPAYFALMEATALLDLSIKHYALLAAFVPILDHRFHAILTPSPTPHQLLYPLEPP